MIIRKTKLLRFVMSNFIFSSLAIFLAMLPLLAFKDRLSYLKYAENSIGILIVNFTKGLNTLLFNEPFWLSINIVLSQFFDSATVVQLFITFPLMIISHKIISNTDHKILVVLLILLVPQVLKNHIIHLRQGVALCFFIIGFYSNNSLLRNIFQTLSCLIHSSFFIILLIKLWASALNKLRLNVYFKVMITAFAFFSLGVLALQIASLVGARQGERYQAISASVSGLGFVFWFTIFILFLSAGQKFLRIHSFQLGIITFYLVNYFTFPVAARVFESGLLIILLSGLDLRGHRRLAFVFLILAFSIIGLITKFDQPMLGWGGTS